MIKKQKIKTAIITQKLEKISKKIFEEHRKIIIQYIGNKPGVYALYEEKDLYYVGRASDLARRINRHLKDRHVGSWTHFSVYFTKKPKYTNDVEATVISIAEPPGNKAKPKIGTVKLKKLIKEAIKRKKQAETQAEYLDLGLDNKKKQKVTKKLKNKPDLKNYFKTPRLLVKIYKNKTYKATLLTSGKIKYKNKLFPYPTSAAQFIVQQKSPHSKVNGWDFWSTKNHKNHLVKLNDLD